MPRVNTGPTRSNRHKKVLKAAKGYRLSRGRSYKSAHETLLHANQYAYIGRKLKKRDFRRLWIQRIHAALTQIDNGPNYSAFISLLKQNQIQINRKILAELAVNDLDTFKSIVAKVYGK